MPQSAFNEPAKVRNAFLGALLKISDRVAGRKPRKKKKKSSATATVGGTPIDVSPSMMRLQQQHLPPTPEAVAPPGAEMGLLQLSAGNSSSKPRSPSASRKNSLVAAADSKGGSRRGSLLRQTTSEAPHLSLRHLHKKAPACLRFRV